MWERERERYILNLSLAVSEVRFFRTWIIVTLNEIQATYKCSLDTVITSSSELSHCLIRLCI